MRGPCRTLALALAAAILSACGGGSASAVAPPAARATAGASNPVQSPTLVTLTLKGSLGFHTASGGQQTSALRRRPAYVNSNPKYLDVWVISGGVATHVVNSSGGSNVSLTADGSQTYQIPLFATAASEIVAYETDRAFATGGYILAVGETDITSFTAGTAPQISLTMLMAANNIGIADNPNNTDSAATINAPPASPFTVGCCSTVYFFATDIDYGFVDVAGVGGVFQPVVTNVSKPGIIAQTPGVNGGYPVSFGCAGGQVNVNLTAANPAYAITNDAYYNLSSYPGADFLYQHNLDPTFHSDVVGITTDVGPTISATIGILANNGCVAGTFNEYPVPTSGSAPWGLTNGPDGALWFTEFNGNNIGRITTGGALTEYAIPVGGREPEGIVTGPDGALWFAESNGNRIGRVTTGGAFTEYLIPTVASDPNPITSGPDGALWFTEFNGNNIGRITTGGSISEFPVPTGGSEPTGIVTGPDGALWFVEWNGNKIGRVTTGGVFSEYPIPTSGSTPDTLIVGPDGALWFTEFNGNKIGRITTGGAFTEYTVPTVGSQPNGLVIGPDGELWFDEYSANKIGRLTLGGAFSEYAIPTVGSGPNGLVTGPDGALWFTEKNGNKIGRLH